MVQADKIGALRCMITRALDDIQTEIMNLAKHGNSTAPLVILTTETTLNGATYHAALPESSFKLTILLSTK